MTRYSVQPRDKGFVKGIDFCLLLKISVKNIGKNISKKSSNKYSQKLLDHAKQSATDTIKTTSKRVIQKIAEAIGDLIGNKISGRITELQNYQKLRLRIIQKQLQMWMIKKCLKKHRYFQKKDRNLMI